MYHPYTKNLQCTATAFHVASHVSLYHSFQTRLQLIPSLKAQRQVQKKRVSTTKAVDQLQGLSVFVTVLLPLISWPLRLCTLSDRLPVF